MVVVLVPQRTVLLLNWCLSSFNRYFYTWPNPKNLWLPLLKALTQQHGIEAYRVLRGIMWLDPLEDFRMDFSIGKLQCRGTNNGPLYTFKNTLYGPLLRKSTIYRQDSPLMWPDSLTCLYIIYIEPALLYIWHNLKVSWKCAVDKNTTSCFYQKWSLILKLFRPVQLNVTAVSFFSFCWYDFWLWILHSPPLMLTLPKMKHKSYSWYSSS